MVATRLGHHGRLLDRLWPSRENAILPCTCTLPVSGDSLEAGELMAAKFGPGHSSRLLSPAVVASGEATGLAGHLQGSFKLTIRGEQSI